MITFICNRYPSLGFYVDGVRKEFSNGTYTATTDAEVKVLEKLQYVSAVESESKDADTTSNPDTNGDGKLTVAEIKAELDKRGISYTSTMKKDQLLLLLEEGE